jgi:hypothetical protein
VRHRFNDNDDNIIFDDFNGDNDDIGEHDDFIVLIVFILIFLVQCLGSFVRDGLGSLHRQRS